MTRVSVYVNMIQWNPLIAMTWNLVVVEVCRSPLILGSKGQGSGLGQGCCLQIKNYAEMRPVSQNKIHCEKINPHLHNALWNDNVKMVFPCTTVWRYRNSIIIIIIIIWYDMTLRTSLAHSVMSSRATLLFESGWICIVTEYTFKFNRLAVELLSLFLFIELSLGEASCV